MDKKERLISAIIWLIIISVIVAGISFYLVYRNLLVGVSFFVFGGILMFVSKQIGINTRGISPDIVFGFIDNGILVLTAALGGIFAGVSGAIIGGVAGNTITDGIGGIFEGKLADKLRSKHIKSERGPLSSMFGKVIGCLIGAGIGLMIVWILERIFNLGI